MRNRLSELIIVLFWPIFRIIALFDKRETREVNLEFELFRQNFFFERLNYHPEKFQVDIASQTLVCNAVLPKIFWDWLEIKDAALRRIKFLIEIDEENELTTITLLTKPIGRIHLNSGKFVSREIYVGGVDMCCFDVESYGKA